MSAAESWYRREFVAHCLAGLGAMSLATELQSSDDAPPPPTMPEDPTAEPSAAGPPVELLLLTALVRNYPSEYYTEDVLQKIYGDIAGDVARGKLLRRVPLHNHDEPACIFRAFRADQFAAEGTP